VDATYICGWYRLVAATDKEHPAENDETVLEAENHECLSAQCQTR
jgi:hypothetical protein